MSEQSGSAAPTPEEIEARLRAQREALAGSVDELAARVDPRVQARAAGEELKERAQETASGLRERAESLRDRVSGTLHRARAGDAEAIRSTATVAAVTGGTIAAAVALGRLLRH
ncbi:DUF3618 domain-containing protein [Actinomyces gaoshouyii]|uniref:DUF3618 domain-containing protein n=1 Tax=Actinomyces gaoshouyii TaxID=1960083 RepID=A0A8H9H8J0_9ACTO|nr:DUF3618 domain-containing protein [Actinomyces gaoshouyii]ARD42338.1 hypothetical protein B6G06_08300 [Actinomyces gaoshouyii]GGO95758.1 hypothetical protein GCM10011612_04380 [Actinomyces gaoshouyii]